MLHGRSVNHSLANEPRVDAVGVEHVPAGQRLDESANLKRHQANGALLSGIPCVARVRKECSWRSDREARAWQRLHS